MGKTVKITFLGDVMCEGQMLSPFCVDGHYNFDKAFAPMKPYFAESNFVCANLETPISFDNQNLTHEQWSFCSPIEFAKALHDSGVNFVSTANNHCLDRGISGIHSTIKSLDDVGLIHTGVFNSKKRKKNSLIIDIEGVKVGFLAYTYGTNAFSNNCYLKLKDKWMVNLFQEQELHCRLSRFCFRFPNTRLARLYNYLRSYFHSVNMHRMVYERKECDFIQRLTLKKDVRRMKKDGADVIILYMHAGGQYNEKETNDTKKLADFIVKQGVDVVVGSHEHVIHGSKTAGNRYIAYSLGNFLGNYGTIVEPFDKNAEYSIAWNIYIDAETKNVEKSTFSVLKSVAMEDYKNGVQTVPLYDLIAKTDDAAIKQSLSNAMMSLATAFSGGEISTIEKEYSQKA